MRLLGVDVPDNKRIEIALRYIYGIGPSRAVQILRETKVDPNIRAKDLSDDQLTKITGCITRNKFVVEGDLRREIAMNLKRLMAVNCYRGIRHRKGLPVRGQRTQTNARTRKGPRKTVGVVRSKEARIAKV
jgi:small subunit ribosomal protein S13